MHWIDDSTFDDFLDQQRRRIVARLFCIQTVAENAADADDDVPAGLTCEYDRQDLLHDGDIERRQ